MDLIFAVFRWLLLAPLSYALIAATWLLSVPLALLSFTTPDGNLPAWCRGFQTDDAPLDEVWINGLYLKNFGVFDGLTKEDFADNNYLKFAARVFWLWRNPAYGYRATLLGYRHENYKPAEQFKRGDWDVNRSSFEFSVARKEGSPLTRAAFMLRSKWFFTKTRCLRVYIGWKLIRPEANKTIAQHIHPFRKIEA